MTPANPIGGNRGASCRSSINVWRVTSGAATASECVDRSNETESRYGWEHGISVVE